MSRVGPVGELSAAAADKQASVTLLCQLSSLTRLHYVKGGKPRFLDEHDVFQDRETLPETLPSMDADRFTLRFSLALSWHLQRTTQAAACGADLQQ